MNKSGDDIPFICYNCAPNVKHAPTLICAQIQHIAPYRKSWGARDHTGETRRMAFARQTIWFPSPKQNKKQKPKTPKGQRALKFPRPAPRKLVFAQAQHLPRQVPFRNEYQTKTRICNIPYYFSISPLITIYSPHTTFIVKMHRRWLYLL